MKLYIFALVLSGLFLSFISKTKTRPSSGIKVIFDSSINDSSIGKAALNYYVYYGCPDTVRVHYGNNICQEIRLTDSSKKITLAYSTFGETFLCPIINSLSDSLVFDNMTHELFHTLAKDTVLVRPFDVFGGEESDFIGFCAKTMNKPRWLVTNSDIEFVMKVFMANY